MLTSRHHCGRAPTETNAQKCITSSNEVLLSSWLRQNLLLYPHPYPPRGAAGHPGCCRRPSRRRSPRRRWRPRRRRRSRWTAARPQPRRRSSRRRSLRPAAGIRGRAASPASTSLPLRRGEARRGLPQHVVSAAPPRPRGRQPLPQLAEGLDPSFRDLPRQRGAPGAPPVGRRPRPCAPPTTPSLSSPTCPT